MGLLCDLVQSSPSRFVLSVCHKGHAESLSHLRPYGLVSASRLETQTRSIALCADLRTRTQSNRTANLESVDKKFIYVPE